MVRSFVLILAGLSALPVAAQAQVTPGQWEVVSTIHSLELPGAPPQVAQAMKARMGKPVTSKNCITPAQAKMGPQEMLKQSPSCRFTKYSMIGGSISTEMTCAQQGGTMTVKSIGRYTANSFDMKGNAVMTGGMAMRMSSSSKGRRIGPCAGGK